MELIVLDSDFAPLQFLKYIELQWNRKFYDVGDFSVQILASEYDPKAKFVQLSGRPELGLIQKVEYSESISGEYVQLSGFFSEKILNEKIIFPTFTAENQSISNIWSDVWEKYILDTDLAYEYHMFTKNSNESVYQTKLSKMATGDSVGEMLSETFKPSKIAIAATYNVLTDSLFFELKKGRDLTQDNTEGNNFVVFSEYFGNLQSATYIEDNSNYKNYAIVQGEGEGADRTTVVVDLSNGSLKREIYVDARDLRKEDNFSNEDYELLLRQRGIEKLSEYVNITNLETGTVANASFEYLKDYDLGDTIDVAVNQIEKSFKAQIIEISEVIGGNSHNITLTFGDEIPTIWKKARIR